MRKKYLKNKTKDTHKKNLKHISHKIDQILFK